MRLEAPGTSLESTGTIFKRPQKEVMARQDEDEFIYLVDRKKDVIICGGENVFPLEVENHVYTHPSVKDTAAVGYPDKRLGENVPIIIEVVPGKALTEEDILTFCEALPRYKQPRKVFFGNIPRNPTGKIEKARLRKQYIGLGEVLT